MVLRRSGTGRVLGRSGKGVWLRLPAGICGVAARGSVPPGPLWLSGSFPWRGQIDGAVVEVSATGLDIAGVTLPFEGARTWLGELPPPERLEEAKGIALDALAGVRPVPDRSLAGVTAPVAAALASGDLAGAAHILGGVGPGLTPAGDDVLCGILLATRARQGEQTEPGLVAVAAGVATTELAHRFLHWAARGQHIAPVHDLLCAAAASDAAGGRAAVGKLDAFGSSSGAATALGLRLGLAAPLP